jgi:hypothetical protein
VSTAPYPGEAARERELEELAHKAGGTVVEIGRSFEGRAIRVARVPCSTADQGRRVLVHGNIHGPEWIGSRVAMSVLERLAIAYLRAALDLAHPRRAAASAR